MKDPLEDLIEHAEASEAEKPWNKWPAIWFVSTEVSALLIVLWAVWHFEFSSYVESVFRFLIG